MGQEVEYAVVAQWPVHQLVRLDYAGSSPVGSAQLQLKSDKASVTNPKAEVGAGEIPSVHAGDSETTDTE